MNHQTFFFRQLSPDFQSWVIGTLIFAASRSPTRVFWASCASFDCTSSCRSSRDSPRCDSPNSDRDGRSSRRPRSGTASCATRTTRGCGAPAASPSPARPRRQSFSARSLTNVPQCRIHTRRPTH